MRLGSVPVVLLSRVPNLNDRPDVGTPDRLAKPYQQEQQATRVGRALAEKYPPTIGRLKRESDLRCLARADWQATL
jgi:hypothetical protein